MACSRANFTFYLSVCYTLQPGVRDCRMWCALLSSMMCVAMRQGVCERERDYVMLFLAIHNGVYDYAAFYRECCERLEYDMYDWTSCARVVAVKHSIRR